MKECRICNQVKNLSEFNAQSKMSDGKSSYCRVCANALLRKWRLENAEHKRAYKIKYESEHKEQTWATTKAYRVKNKEKVRGWAKSFDKNRPERALFYDARRRARKRDVPFTIVPEDIIFPEFCPILGVKLERTGLNNRDTSPSLDAIIPSKGYVKGNIAIISFRANRIKNDAKTHEVAKLLNWMQKRDKEVEDQDFIKTVAWG